jgi:hypothetical protein
MIYTNMVADDISYGNFSAEIQFLQILISPSGLRI